MITFWNEWINSMIFVLGATVRACCGIKVHKMYILRLRISLSNWYFALCFVFHYNVSNKNETSIMLITIKRIKRTIVGRPCIVSPELSRGKSRGRAEPQLTELFDFFLRFFPKGPREQSHSPSKAINVQSRSGRVLHSQRGRANIGA